MGNDLMVIIFIFEVFFLHSYILYNYLIVGFIYFILCIMFRFCVLRMFGKKMVV